RSIMAVQQVTVRPGRELLLGQARGREAASRLRAAGFLEGLRGDVRSELEEELERLEAGSAFPGVELFGAYLDPRRRSLLDHLPAQTVVLDFEPDRQLAEARELEQETLMLAEAESRDGELPRGFVPPMVPVDRLLAGAEAGWPRLLVSTGELEGSVDLGWHELDPVVGRAQALAPVAAR